MKYFVYLRVYYDGRVHEVVANGGPWDYDVAMNKADQTRIVAAQEGVHYDLILIPIKETPTWTQGQRSALAAALKQWQKRLGMVP